MFPDNFLFSLRLYSGETTTAATDKMIVMQIHLDCSNCISFNLSLLPGEPKRIGIPTNMTVTSKIFMLEKINWNHQKALIFIIYISKN